VITQPPQLSPLVAARWATIGIFASAGAGLASWFPYIPHVQERLSLSNGALGLSLLGMPIGGILCAQIASPLIGKIGSRTVTLITSIIFFVALPIPVLASNIALLLLGLILIGGSSGLRNVAMNAQAVEIERRYGRPILSTFHAAFSLGLLASAALAVLVIGAGWSPAAHVVIVALILGAMSVLASQKLLRIASERTLGPAHLARPNLTLIKLGVIAVALLIAEGAMADWASVFVRTVLNGSAQISALAYAAFTATMALGRLTGDKTTAYLGPVRMLRSGGALITLGLMIAALVPNTAVAIIGFALVGLGVSCGYPIMISAAGRVAGVSTAAALTIVVTIGSIGFLLGPPLIGLLAEITSLRIALLTVSLAGLIEIALAPTAAPTAAQVQGKPNPA